MVARRLAAVSKLNRFGNPLREGAIAMSTEPDIPLPPIVIVLRVVGCLCPLVAFITAGATNASDAAGWMMILSSLIATLLWFALGSVIRLLNRIEKRLSHSESISSLNNATAQ
jgi:hypothetical protein